MPCELNSALTSLYRAADDQTKPLVTLTDPNSSELGWRPVSPVLAMDTLFTAPETLETDITRDGALQTNIAADSLLHGWAALPTEFQFLNDASPLFFLEGGSVATE